MAEDTVFYLSNNPNDNGISLPIEGTLTSDSYENIQGITKSNLVKVEIGNSVTSIGNEAFKYCYDLQSVTIGNSVTSIGTYAFGFCSSLQSVTIGDSVTRIGANAFFSCSKLQSVTIPDSVTSIGRLAFMYCSALQSVTIPDSVTSIGNEAFYQCYALQSVTIGDSVTSIGISAFFRCSALQSVTIGDSVTSIDDRAFDRCSALQSVTIPNSVTSIGKNAFQGAGITSVKINFEVAQTLGLKTNAIRQNFFGATNVDIIYTYFIQPGTISGTYSNDQNLQNDKFDTGSEKVIIRLYVPGKRIYENDRSRILIADFTNIEKNGTNIRNIKWEKRIKNGENWENWTTIESETERTYIFTHPDTFTYPDTSTQFRVSCSYDDGRDGTLIRELSNPTFPLSANEQDTIEENIQKRDNSIDFDELNEFFNKTFTVTVESINNENKYNIDDVRQKTLTLYNGSTYRFESSDFNNHPFAFSTKKNDSDSKYTTNVTSGDDYVEITIDQTTPSTLYYYCENHANMGGKINIRYENFNNTEFRKTLTMLQLGPAFTTISNAGLFENESFLYENMQEVEVPKTVRNITGTPFPASTTRYYIYSIWKYLEKNRGEFPWVNDTTKQFYFYLGSTPILANTRDDDGVALGIALVPFIYAPFKYNSHEKCENAQYVMTSNAKYNKPTTIKLISNYYRNNNNITEISEVKNNLLWDLFYSKRQRTEVTGFLETTKYTTYTRILTSRTLSNNDVIIESGNKFKFPNGIAEFASNGGKDLNEYLRLMDIVVKYGNQNKTFKVAIRSGTWGKNQTYTNSETSCFSGNSQLILKDGTKKSFHDIQYGDEIQVCSNTMELSYSKVIFLSHLYNKTISSFVTITTKSNAKLHLTHNHYIPISNANNKLKNVMAKDVIISDRLYILQDNKIILDEIQNITETKQEGLYACNTSSGEYIVVDNVVASPFIGDRDDLSYISKYVLSYNMTRIYAKTLTMMDNIGILFFVAPLLRFTNDVVTNILKMFRQ